MLSNRDYALEWFSKARNDLHAAMAVLESEYGITDVPCFHAQQCVEKALKGVLVLHDVSFVRTHDLMVLLAEIVKIDESFLEYKEVCEELCEFAVEVRYPGGISVPPEGEAKRFVKKAELILDKAKSFL
jgi:HEPN domain-containing protein